MSGEPFVIHIRPRESISWDEFVTTCPTDSIALDGFVRGGPRFDEDGRRVNFDHHDGVVREATMSTAMQVFMAIKGGLMHWFRSRPVHVFINDTDQDTSLAVWLLRHYKLFEGTASIPHVQRLLSLTDRMDITGGAFPINLDDRVLHQHNWVFGPYTDLRKSGGIASADERVLHNNLDAVLARLDRFLMNEAEETELDGRHAILFDHPVFKIVDEIGGNEARYLLFAGGMNAFVSVVARRPDGKTVFTIGRRSRYIRRFPVPRFYSALNAREGRTLEDGWNGSDIVGGIRSGSALGWEDVRDTILPLVES